MDFKYVQVYLIKILLQPSTLMCLMENNLLWVLVHQEMYCDYILKY